MTLVKPLNNDLAYVSCPLCAQQGNPNSPLRREMHVFKCALQHVIDPSQLAGADMVKLSDYQPESPEQTDMAYKIFCHPKLWEDFNNKFRGRVWSTLRTLMAALVDGNIVMITGEQAAELRKLGVKSGPEIMSAIRSVKELERERDEMQVQIEKFTRLMVSAQNGDGEGQASENNNQGEGR